MTGRGNGTLSNLSLAKGAQQTAWKSWCEQIISNVAKHAPLGHAITEGRWRMRPRTREPMMRHEVQGVTGKRYFRADKQRITDKFNEDDIANNEGT